MPAYPWLCDIDREVDLSTLKQKINALRVVGVPYPKGYEEQALADFDAQATQIREKLKVKGIQTGNRTEIVALIAYLHKLGRDLQPATVATK